jgi:phospholipase C
MIDRTAALAAALACAACSAPVTSPPFALRQAQGDTPIAHVVFVIQENRSFNDLFMGYPGAKTARYGHDKKGRKIGLTPIGLEKLWDLGHSSDAFFTACDGTGTLPGTNCKMDGWNGEYVPPGAPRNVAYAYVPKEELKPYWTIARDYVLADRMFASNLDGSFVAHQYAVAAYASRSVDYPGESWGCEGGKFDTIGTLTPQRASSKPIEACFDNDTIAAEADRLGVSWRFYASTINGDGGFWSSYQADRKIYSGPDWSRDVINPPAQFLADVGSGKLANVTWIVPTFETSDHPGANATQGPAWIASIVDAIGASKFWQSTAIFIMWDDWGGWFDPVPPVYEDYDGLGFRVPLLVVSPFARRGYVTHVQYETSSVLRYIEDNFGLPPLAASDARANDPVSDAFDYTQPPRTFEKIPGGKPPAYWLRSQRNSNDRQQPAEMPGND